MSQSDRQPDLFGGDVADSSLGRAESLAMLALSTVAGVGYKTLYAIRKARKTFQDVLMASSQAGVARILEAAGVRNAASLAERIASEQPYLLQRGHEYLLDLEFRKVRIIHSFESEFPPRLNQLVSPPFWLFVEGNWSLLNRPSIAVVGTRQADDRGIFLTHCVCYLLAGTDICTVSGLAEGIDREAHHASLMAGVPTIAVMGTGINHMYPSTAVELRNDLLRAGGCVVSEYLPDEPPNKQSFVWRNRIQAGLSQITIPAQWQIPSGTAHTVNFALDIRRPVVGVVTPVDGDTDETRFLREKGQPVFTLPQQSEEFREYVTRVLE